MRPKEYLLQYRRALERVRQLDDRLRELYLEAEVQAVRPKEINVRGSGRRRDRTAELAAEIADTSARLTDQRIEALEVMNEVAAVIDRVPDEMQARLLYDRYIAGMSWERTAADLNFDPAYTRGRLHGAALEAVRKLATKCNKCL